MSPGNTWIVVSKHRAGSQGGNADGEVGAAATHEQDTTRADAPEANVLNHRDHAADHESGEYGPDEIVVAAAYGSYQDRYVDAGTLVAVADGFVEFDWHCFARLTERGCQRPVARRCLDIFGTLTSETALRPETRRNAGVERVAPPLTP